MLDEIASTMANAPSADLAAVLVVGGTVAVAAGLAGSAFFGGFETGAYTVNRVRLAARSARGEARAVALREELIHPNRMLTTCLIGNNAAHNLLSYGVSLLLLPVADTEHALMAINTLIVLPASFLLGEVIPKDLFRAATDSWTYSSVRLFRAFRVAFTAVGLVPMARACGEGFAKLLGARRQQEGTSRQRIGAMLREGSGLLSDAQLAVADRALGLGRRKVAEQMIPWKRAISLPIDADPAAREALLRRVPHSSIPLLDASGRPVGLLRAMDALADPTAATTALALPAVLLEPETPVTKALLRMRMERSPLAVIVDAGGTPQGIVGMGDLVQPLLGRLPEW